MITMALIWTIGSFALMAVVVQTVSAVHSARKNRKDRILEAPAPKNSLTKSVADVRTSLWGESTLAISTKVERLEAAVRRLAPKVDELDSRSRHTVESTATTYLPDAVKAYLQIPRDARAKDHVDGTKTATELLGKQLDIMNAELDKILKETRKVDATELVVHGRFLEEKYGKAEPVVENVSEFGATNAGRVTIQTAIGGARWELDSEALTVRDGAGRVVERYETPKAEYVPESVPKELRRLSPKAMAYGPLPEGEYEVVVIHAETTDTKSGYPAVRLKFLVDGGMYDGRPLWKMLVLPSAAAGRGVFFNHLAALGVSDHWASSIEWQGEEGAIQDAFQGRRAVAHVKVDEWNGRMVNSVRYLTKSDS